MACQCPFGRKTISQFQGTKQTTYSLKSQSYFSNGFLFLLSSPLGRSTCWLTWSIVTRLGFYPPEPDFVWSFGDFKNARKNCVTFWYIFWIQCETMEETMATFLTYHDFFNVWVCEKNVWNKTSHLAARSFDVDAANVQCLSSFWLFIFSWIWMAGRAENETKWPANSGKNMAKRLKYTHPTKRPCEIFILIF